MHLFIVLKSRLHKYLPIIYNLFYLFPCYNQFISPFNSFIINKIKFFFFFWESKQNKVAFLFLSKPVIYLNAFFISILENKQKKKKKYIYIYIYIYKIWDGIINNGSIVSHRCKLFFFWGGSQANFTSHYPFTIDKSLKCIHCILLFNALTNFLRWITQRSTNL